MLTLQSKALSQTGCTGFSVHRADYAGHQTRRGHSATITAQLLPLSVWLEMTTTVTVNKPEFIMIHRSGGRVCTVFTSQRKGMLLNVVFFFKNLFLPIC